jgi:hypothetical protein
MCAQTVAAADFRGNNWGDSPEAVIAVEGEPLRRETNGAAVILSYEKCLRGKKVRVRYCFAPGGKLAIGGYYCERVKDLDRFFIWVDEIAASYGEPEKKDWVCTDDPRTVDEFYAGGPDGLADGLKQNLFQLYYLWETGNTRLYVLAWGDGGLIHTTLSLSSVRYIGSFLDSLSEATMREGRFW